jgi:hypothetical protein
MAERAENIPLATGNLCLIEFSFTYLPKTIILRVQVVTRLTTIKCINLTHLLVSTNLFRRLQYDKTTVYRHLHTTQQNNAQHSPG